MHIIFTKHYSRTCTCGHLYYAVTCIKRSHFHCLVIDSFCVLSICCVSSSLLQRYNLLVVTLQNCVFPSRCYIAQYNITSWQIRNTSNLIITRTSFNDILLLLSVKAVKTIRFAHAVTSIMQSPVLKGHIFIVLSLKISCELNLFKKSPDLSHKSPFLCLKCDLLRQFDCILLLYMSYVKVFFCLMSWNVRLSSY
jgi:hypothetical protein